MIIKRVGLFEFNDDLVYGRFNLFISDATISIPKKMMLWAIHKIFVTPKQLVKVSFNMSPKNVGANCGIQKIFGKSKVVFRKSALMAIFFMNDSHPRCKILFACKNSSFIHSFFYYY